MARNISEEQKKVLATMKKRDKLIQTLYYKEKMTGYEIVELVAKEYAPISLQRCYEIIKKGLKK